MMNKRTKRPFAGGGNMKFAVIGTRALILAALPSPTLAASTASIERKVERAEKELRARSRGI